jgi:hypothetical protein
MAKFCQIFSLGEVGHYGLAWLTTNFCHAKDLARRICEIMSKNVFHINYEILPNFGTKQNGCQNLDLPKF